MPKWTPFPQIGEYAFDAASTQRHWTRLHSGDAEPLPSDASVLEAWALFHNGEFQKCVQAGLNLGSAGGAGGAGITVANKATCVYANYLEKKEKTRLDLYLEVAQRAEAQIALDANNVSAHYWLAYSLGRYSQGISVAKALAQGLGSKIKTALETTIQLQPKHADAHIALGAFHAEVIDKVGPLIGGMTYGAKKETGLRMFQEALKLNFSSAICMTEYANALVMLEGDRQLKEATRLYQKASALKPADAKERLDVEMARAELAD